MAGGANNDDILVRMMLDIDDVTTKASQVEQVFKSLSQNSVSAFEAVNTSLKTLGTSITETKTLMSGMATDIAAITGVNVKANAATLETAKSAKTAAQAVLEQARANKALQDAATVAAQTQVSANRELLASIQAVTVARKADAEAAKMQATALNDVMSGGFDNKLYRRVPKGAFLNYNTAAEDEASSARANYRSKQGMYDNLFAASGSDASFKEQAQYAKDLRMEVEKLGGVTKATRLGLIDQQDLAFMSAYGQEVRALPTYWDRTVGSFGKHIGQFALFSAALGAVTVGYEALRESIARAGEAQEQMVQLRSAQRVDKAAGIPLGPASSGEVLGDAGTLAAKWGDNINDVVQDVTQWYKVTGDLNNALFLTDNALKFQTASGTDLEDTYRTLIGLASQMKGVKMGNGDNDPFDLSKTPEILNDIFTAATAAGAGMRQVNIQGAEIGKGTANSAEILLHAFEQDGEALKKLGVTMADAVAINQSLITAMGNTGGEADGAAEKVSRLVGGIMELSKQSKANTLAKDLGSQKFEGLRNVLNAGGDNGDLVVKFAEYFEKLDTRSKNVLATTMAGNRQYGIANNLLDSALGTLAKIEKAEEDKNALDKTAKDMMDTFNMQAKQLQGLWSSIAVTIGGPLIAALSTAVSLAGKFLNTIGLIGSFAGDQMGGNSQFNSDLKAKFGYTPAVTPVHSFAAGSSFSEGHEKAQSLPGHTDDMASLRAVLGPALAQHGAQMDAPSLALSLGILNNRNYTFQSAMTALATTANAKDNQNVLHTLFGNKFDDVGGVQRADDIFFMEHPSAAFAQYDKSKKGLLPPGGDGNQGPSVPDTTGGANKPLKDYEVAAQGLADLKDQYLDSTQKLKDHSAALESDIASQDRQLQTFGYTQQVVNKVNAERQQDMATLHASSAEIRNEQIPAYEKVRDAALAHAKAVGQNTQEGKGWMQVYRSAGTELRSLQSELDTNTQKWDENRDGIFSATKALADYQSRETERAYSTQHSDMQKAYGLGHSSLDDLTGLENARHLREEQILLNEAKQDGGRITDALRQKIEQEADTHKANADAIQDEATQLKQSLTTKIADDETKLLDAYTKMSGMTRERAQTLRDEAQLTQDEVKFTQDYEKAIGQAGAALRPLVESWGQVEQAQLSANRAAVEYTDKLTELQATPLMKGLTAGFDTLGTDVGSSVTDQLFGITADNNQVQSISNQIQLLQNQKTVQDQIYSDQLYHSALQEAQHKTYLYDLDEEIKKLQQKAAAIKQGESEHGLLTKAAQAMTKTIVDDMVKQLATNVEKSIESVFVKNPMQDQANQALRLYADATNGAQRQNMQAYTSASQLIAQPMKDLTDSLNGSGSNGTPVASAMEDLAVSLTDLMDSSGSGGGVIDPGGAYSAVTAGAAQFGISAAPFNLGSLGQVGLWSGGGSSGSSGGMLGGIMGFLGGGGLGGLGSGAIGGLAMLGGGGSLLGLGAGVAGLGAMYSQPNGKGGDAMLGSLAGVAATGGILAALTGGFAGGLFPSLISAGLAFNPLMLGAILLGGAVLGGGLGGMFGPKLNAQNNPDIFDTQNFGQDMANLAGNGPTSGLKGSWTANGQNFSEDPAMAQEMGNQGELMFISNWIKNNPTQAAKVLSPQQIQDFSNLSNVTPNGGPIANGKNGNLTLSNGITMYWKDLSQSANDASQAILNLKNASASASQAIVSLNMYGGNQGYFPYNYEIPGYEFDPKLYQPGGSSTPGGPTSGTPGNPAVPPKSPVNPRFPIQGPIRGGVGSDAAYVNRAMTGGTTTPIIVSGNLNIPINLDGRQITIATQAYTLRANVAGYQRVT